MKTILTLFAICFTTLVCFSQSKQLVADRYSKSKPTQTFTLTSEYTGDREYIMHVTHAIDSVIPGRKYPVLYYTDAWLNVDFFHQAGDWLTFYKEIQPVILVGISFEATEEGWIENRKEDFLPDLLNADSVSGAKNFLNFIKNELFPYVEEHFPADAADRGLFGYSYGGLFATWVLREDPMLFQRIGIASPSLWYADFKLLKDSVLINNISRLKQSAIFVEYGNTESDNQKAGAEALFNLLDANKDIQLEKFVLDGGHYSAYPETIIKTLTYLYSKE